MHNVSMARLRRSYPAPTTAYVRLEVIQNRGTLSYVGEVRVNT